jgi:hypothetical protein
MRMEEKTLCHRREVGRHDRWTGAIVGPGGDYYDYSPVLGTVDAGTILVTDGLSARTGTKAGSMRSSADVGFSESSLRKIKQLPLGRRSNEMEPWLVGFPATEDAGNQPCEPETGNGKGGKRGESGRRARPNTNTADVIPTASEDSDSDPLSQSTGPVRSDRVEGVLFFNLVPRSR